MRSFMLLAVVVCVTLALVAEARHSSRQEWRAYKQKYGKVYETPEEDARRFAFFMRSKAKLAMHKEDVVESHQRGLNHLSDLSESELKQLNGFKLPTSNTFSLEQHMQNSPDTEQFLAYILADKSKPVPDELDWRKVPGRVSAVKDQGLCGSCWAFSTTGLLEGQQVIHGNNKTLVALSEEDLVDCSKSDYGCNGGIMDLALKDIANMGGIESEQAYPYVGEPLMVYDCKFNKTRSVMTDVGPVYVAQKDEKQLKQVVAKYGPVAVALDAKDLFDYKQGVIIGKYCQDTVKYLDHAVLIVGYGTDAKHGDFWIVKNSWSDKWGEKGYFRISRGKNTCGISLYPIIAKL